MGATPSEIGGSGQPLEGECGERLAVAGNGRVPHGGRNPKPQDPNSKKGSKLQSATPPRSAGEPHAARPASAKFGNAYSDPDQISSRQVLRCGKRSACEAKLRGPRSQAGAWERDKRSAETNIFECWLNAVERMELHGNLGVDASDHNFENRG